MTILAQQLTRREYRWQAWKTASAIKGFRTQYEENSERYMIWAYDGPEIHITHVYKGSLHQSLLDAGYTQEQSDIDLADFEANYKASANAALSEAVADTIGANGFITVGTSATAARVSGSNLSKRSTLSVMNNGSATIYWGFSSGVTTSTGMPIYKGQSAGWTVGPNITIWLISGSAGNNVRVVEMS